MLIKAIPLTAVIALSTPVFAANFDTRLPSGATLTLQLPEGWRALATQNDKASTIKVFSAPDRTEPTLLLTAFQLPPTSPITCAEALKDALQKQATRLLPTALQDHAEILDLHASQGIGYFYHLTDKRPESGPSDYREMHQGAILITPYLVTITILTHPSQDELVTAATKVAASISLVINH